MIVETQTHDCAQDGLSCLTQSACTKAVHYNTIIKSCITLPSHTQL